MFELVDYKPEHATAIVAEGAVQPEFKDCDEVEPWSQTLAKYPAMTGMWDGRPVSCGGIVILVPGHRGEAWFLAAEDIGDYHIDPQIARNKFYDMIIESELKRVESPCRADFPAGISYVKYLGFVFEAKLEAYWPPDVDALMHVIITDKET